MFDIIFTDSESAFQPDSPLVLIIFKHLTNAIFVISIIILLIYGKIIVYCMHKEMKVFKLLSFCYIICLILMEVCLVAWKPILLPHKIIYPIGLLSPMGPKAAFLFLVATVFVMSLTLEVLLITLFERYVTIFAFSKQALFHAKPYGYGIIYTIYLGFFATAFTLCWLILPNEEEMRMALMPFKEILFTNKNSNLSFVIIPSFEKVQFLIVLLLIGIYAFSRLIAGICLIYVNFKKMKLTWSSSQKTQRHLQLMFRTTVTQLCTMFLFGFTPACLWFLSTLFISSGKTSDFFFILCFILTMAYPIFDVIIVVSVVAPYRAAVRKILRMDFQIFYDTHQKSNSKANVFVKTVSIF